MGAPPHGAGQCRGLMLIASTWACAPHAAGGRVLDARTGQTRVPLFSSFHFGSFYFTRVGIAWWTLRGWGINVFRAAGKKQQLPIPSSKPHVLLEGWVGGGGNPRSRVVPERAAGGQVQLSLGLWPAEEISTAFPRRLETSPFSLMGEAPQVAFAFSQTARQGGQPGGFPSPRGQQILKSKEVRRTNPESAFFIGFTGSTGVTEGGTQAAAEIEINPEL